jgi:hypothetical protein
VTGVGNQDVEPEYIEATYGKIIIPRRQGYGIQEKICEMHLIEKIDPGNSILYREIPRGP